MLERAGFEKGGQAVVLGGATIAGFFAAACSLPFDFVKTRIQKMEPNPDGTMPYKGPVDCALKTMREEGLLKFYTGFPTYCIRCAAFSNPVLFLTPLAKRKMAGPQRHKISNVVTLPVRYSSSSCGCDAAVCYV